MIYSTVDKNQTKGWFAGPWNSALDIPIGYANQGVHEKHVHSQMYEIYLIAKGHSTVLVNDKEYDLKEGDMLVVEPGDVHTFIQSSNDYLHFVIQSPFVKDDKTIVE